jgi:hypothetical protein
VLVAAPDSTVSGGAGADHSRRRAASAPAWARRAGAAHSRRRAASAPAWARRAGANHSRRRAASAPRGRATLARITADGVLRARPRGRTDHSRRRAASTPALATLARITADGVLGARPRARAALARITADGVLGARPRARAALATLARITTDGVLRACPRGAPRWRGSQQLLEARPRGRAALARITTASGSAPAWRAALARITTASGSAPAWARRTLPRWRGSQPTACYERARVGAPRWRGSQPTGRASLSSSSSGFTLSLPGRRGCSDGRVNARCPESSSATSAHVPLCSPKQSRDSGRSRRNEPRWLGSERMAAGVRACGVRATHKRSEVSSALHDALECAARSTKCVRTRVRRWVEVLRAGQ